MNHVFNIFQKKKFFVSIYSSSRILSNKFPSSSTPHTCTLAIAANVIALQKYFEHLTIDLTDRIQVVLPAHNDVAKV